ncbi:hypothetical protein V1506DRAFT_196438 [Lipomyces tetrasporus]
MLLISGFAQTCLVCSYPAQYLLVFCHDLASPPHFRRISAASFSSYRTTPVCESMDQERPPSVSTLEISAPRRTLRKGTHSCAECKRRKIRCYFDRTSAAVCVECHRRGSPCMSQEFVDVPAPEDEDLRERLKRVEQMLEKVTEKLFTQSLGSQHIASTAQSLPSVASSEDQRYDTLNDHGQFLVISDTTTDATNTASESSAETPASHISSQSPERLPAELNRFVLPKYADSCRVLHAAFPSQHDAHILFEAGRAAVFLQALCIPYHELFNEGNSQTSAMLSAIPPITAHPVLLARKLLHHSLCIQQLDPSFDRRALQGNDDLRSAMQRYYDLASTMVTCHDELLDSLEGLECLMCEGVYLVNCGNLRRALACLRRASTLAQFMGLHRKALYKGTLKQLDPMTRVSGEFTWAHIAYLERYISLLLGMPTSITSARFGNEEKSVGQTDAEWFEKVQIDICEHIIGRNQERDYDFSATHKIDNILNRMASSMPADWWTPMDLPPGTGPDEMMSRVICAQMQIVHYNLLTVLHLPYLLRSNTPNHRFDYNKETCLYASREVLSRFITFRSIVRVVYCCRLVDFCAFTAAMTLLLAYLNGSGHTSSMESTHQRVGDRALIGKTLETLDELNRLNGDELSRETAKLTRRLMDLEIETAKGNNAYTCRIAEEDQKNTTGEDPGEALCLTIPYFGCVRLASEPLSQIWALEVLPTGLPSAPYSSSPQASMIHPLSMTATHPVQPLQPQQLPLPGGPQIPFSVYHLANIHQQGEQETLFDLPMPDLMAGAEDWAFQGVDAAFFDSLTGGAGTSLINWDTHWSGI